MSLFADNARILATIVAPLSQRDRSSLARTCHALEKVAKALYSEVTLRDGNGQSAKFLEAITETPEPAELTTTITFRYLDGRCADADAADILPLLPNLRHLKIVSCAPDQDEENLIRSHEGIIPRERLRDVFGSSALSGLHPHLKTCWIEYLDSRDSLGDLSVLLFHPEMQKFQVEGAWGLFYGPWTSCGGIIPPMRQRHCTNLQILKLLYCDVNSEELKQVLSIPKALKLFELAYVKRRDGYSPSIEDCMTALEQQVESLECTSLWGAFNQERNGTYALAKFPSLRHLRIKYEHLCGYSRLGPDFLLRDRLPKTLENVFLDIEMTTESVFRECVNVVDVFQGFLPKLRDLEIVVLSVSSAWRLIDGQLPMIQPKDENRYKSWKQETQERQVGYWSRFCPTPFPNTRILQHCMTDP